ncbi:MAG: TrmH family RNA methyltransferase [Alloprevotella sp.]
MQTRILSKNKQKLIRQLSQKKYRDALGLFLAEGPKVVSELMGRFPCRLLVCTAEWLSAHPHAEADEVAEVSLEGLQQASLLKTPRSVLAVFARRPAPPAEGLAEIPRRSLTLALDGVQDPGNVGTILRVADWFGIEDIFCSLDTADAFAPKTVQATMGALARVRVHYVNLPAFLAQLPPDVPVYGTFLSSPSLWDEPLTSHGVIIMGNEGSGISPAVAEHVGRRLHIPSFPPSRPTSESLNVAIAAAIVCAEFRRRS